MMGGTMPERVCYRVEPGGSKPNGVVLWEGPSEFDGAPLVVVLVGLNDASTNRKTGAMLQTYILRADMSPVAARRVGLDSSYCGTCPHRSPLAGGDGGCYVNWGQGPRSVQAAYARGVYPRVSLEAAATLVRESGRGLRIGTAGDPGAVPAIVWEILAPAASFRTGYTHAWRTRADLRGLVMASVDSREERETAQAAGWATFRVVPLGEEPARIRGEAQCPASAEAGKRVTCATCPIACNGARGAVIGRAIVAHGATARRIGKGHHLEGGKARLCEPMPRAHATLEGAHLYP
jgi:hypothetical protein